MDIRLLVLSVETHKITTQREERSVLPSILWWVLSLISSLVIVVWMVGRGTSSALTPWGSPLCSNSGTHLSIANTQGRRKLQSSSGLRDRRHPPGFSYSLSCNAYQLGTYHSISFVKLFVHWGALFSCPTKHVEKPHFQAWNHIATCFWKVRRCL